MLKLRFGARLLVLIPLFALSAAAQAPNSNWSTIQALAPGTEVRVAATGKPVSGTVSSVTESAIVLSVDSRPQMFDKAQITSISTRKKGHRARNAVIGMGVGLAAGLVIGAASTTSSQGQGWDALRGIAIGAVGGAGAVAGTVVGAVWPTGGWHKIYQR